MFHPDKGRISCGSTDADGHYDLVFLRDMLGAIVGKHRVRISTLSEDCRKELVPACYNTKSTLEKEVVSGNNEIDFDLQ